MGLYAAVLGVVGDIILNIQQTVYILNRLSNRVQRADASL